MSQVRCFGCVNFEKMETLTKLFLSFALEVYITKDNTDAMQFHKLSAYMGANIFCAFKTLKV